MSIPTIIKLIERISE